MAGEHTLAEPKLKVTARCTPTPLTNVPTKCQPSTPYGIKEINPDKILKLMVTMTRSKVKSTSHHDVAHLQPPTNVPTKYQLPIPYGFKDIAQIRFYRSKSLQQGQIKVTT